MTTRCRKTFMTSGVIASVIDLMPLADGSIRTVARGLER